MEQEGNLQQTECKKLCRVAVRMPGDNSVLTYEMDSKLDLQEGSLVKVPLGKRLSSGCVVDLERENATLEKPDGVKLKAVNSRMDNILDLSVAELELYKWMSRYYHYSLGLLIFDCLPKIMKRPKPFKPICGSNQKFPFELNSDQRCIYQAITQKRSKGFSRNYIHGVTGSGKTLVYLSLIKDVLASGKSVLFLLPEINLTPQFTQTFETYLDTNVIEYHSGITDGEKYQAWKYLKENKDQPLLVMGVRSSVFLPVENLGLVIVDEEHDSSFKQSDRCPYNGRDVAIKKAQLANATLVLGSATPSVENYYQFSQMDNGNDNYFELEKRASGNLPSVEIVDSRNLDYEDESWPLMPTTVDAIKMAVDKKEQVLVFINRLGFANFIQCYGCGHKFTDPNTQTPLRYFKKKGILASAYSEYKIPLPDICPECGNMKLMQNGFGTEKVQEVLRKIFVDKKIDRFDRDEIRNTKQLQEKLDSFHSHEIDIFVGTQMLSKGHNFTRVNLVVILGIDGQMNFADFRSIERCYQLLTQVTGRAGRYSPHAKVLIQTLSIGAPIFDIVKKHSFREFYEQELPIRQMTELPPFSRLVLLAITAKKREDTVKYCTDLMHVLKRQIKHHKFEVTLMGPNPAMIERRADSFTWNIILKSKSINDLHQLSSIASKFLQEETRAIFKVDVDPYNCI